MCIRAGQTGKPQVLHRMERGSERGFDGILRGAVNKSENIYFNSTGGFYTLKSLVMKNNCDRTPFEVENTHYRRLDISCPCMKASYKGLRFMFWNAQQAFSRLMYIVSF